MADDAPCYLSGQSEPGVSSSVMASVHVIYFSYYRTIHSKAMSTVNKCPPDMQTTVFVFT